MSDSKDTKELRGDAPADLVRALDALALSYNMSRHQYMVEILEKHVKSEMDRITVIVATMRGNPLLQERRRKGAGSATSYNIIGGPTS